jgi:hypothetical protein
MDTYTVKIEARDEAGDWQTMSVETVPTAVAVDGLPTITPFQLHTDDIPGAPGTRYLWLAFDATPEGSGSGPIVRYRGYHKLTAQQVAEDTAANQTIAEGEDWRVRVYMTDHDSHLAEAGPGAEEIPLADLVARMANLPKLRGVEHAREAAALRPLVQTALARSRQAAVYEATRGMPWSIVAAELGISEAAINRLVTQHRAQR